MLLDTVYENIKKSLEHDYKMPEKSLLSLRIHEALVYVAMKCVPSSLVVEISSGQTMLRILPNGVGVKMPKIPDFLVSSEMLDIDESLSYAVINFVCYLLADEKRAQKFFAMSEMWISTYRQSEISGKYCDIEE